MAGPEAERAALFVATHAVLLLGFGLLAILASVVAIQCDLAALVTTPLLEHAKGLFACGEP